MLNSILGAKAGPARIKVKVVTSDQHAARIPSPVTRLRTGLSAPGPAADRDCAAGAVTLDELTRGRHHLAMVTVAQFAARRLERDLDAR